MCIIIFLDLTYNIFLTNNTDILYIEYFISIRVKEAQNPPLVRSSTFTKKEKDSLNVKAQKVIHFKFKSTNLLERAFKYVSQYI